MTVLAFGASASAGGSAVVVRVFVLLRRAVAALSAWLLVGLQEAVVEVADGLELSGDLLERASSGRGELVAAAPRTDGWLSPARFDRSVVVELSQDAIDDGGERGR